MPSRRDEHVFTSVRAGKERGRPALIVEFMSVNRQSKSDLVESEHGHEDCFGWSGPLATKGHVWVDAATHDVLRVDRHLDGPVDIRVSRTLQREHGLGDSIVLEQDDMTMRYRAVVFHDPDEVIRLPESIQSTTVIRSGLQSMRRTDTFSGYRRFLGTGRIKEP